MSIKKVYIDSRWKNCGGIGTFYERINELNKYSDAELSGKPMSPLDCIRTSIQLFFRKDSIFFFPGYIPPVFLSSDYIFTIHDLNHLERAENSSALKRLFYKFVIKRGCRKARYIFTVSEFSREKIIEWADVSPDKVINVSNGVSPDFSPEGEHYALGYKYLLCVSNRKGHKNEIGTLEAFKKSDIEDDIKLVFTGKPDETINNKISELGLQDRIVFTGFIPEEDLPKLYRSAIGLVFVSFYEGFGLPVIEAQASGIPVITSNSTALKEIAGEGALLVDPYNTDEISKAIRLICENENNLCKKLITNGFKNCSKYTWEKTAHSVKKHIDLIR